MVMGTHILQACDSAYELIQETYEQAQAQQALFVEGQNAADLSSKIAHAQKLGVETRYIEQARDRLVGLQREESMRQEQARNRSLELQREEQERVARKLAQRALLVEGQNAADLSHKIAHAKKLGVDIQYIQQACNRLVLLQREEATLALQQALNEDTKKSKSRPAKRPQTVEDLEKSIADAHDVGGVCEKLLVEAKRCLSKMKLQRATEFRNPVCLQNAIIDAKSNGVAKEVIESAQEKLLMVTFKKCSDNADDLLRKKSPCPAELYRMKCITRDAFLEARRWDRPAEQINRMEKIVMRLQKRIAEGFRPGTTVRLVGLQNRPNLNGTLCTLVEFDDDKGRWQVRPADLQVHSEGLLIKPDNLEPLAV